MAKESGALALQIGSKMPASSLWRNKRDQLGQGKSRELSFLPCPPGILNVLKDYSRPYRTNKDAAAPEGDGNGVL
jgi:hypothetical protein